MPRTIEVKDISELTTLQILDAPAFETLKQRLEGGSKIERVESLASDPGDDYVKFLADGEEVVTIPGY